MTCEKGVRNMRANRKRAPLFAVLLTVFLLCSRSTTTASDWGSCASDLDDIHSASDAAADAVREAEQAQDDVESKRSDTPFNIPALSRRGKC